MGHHDFRGIIRSLLLLNAAVHFGTLAHRIGVLAPGPAVKVAVSKEKFHEISHRTAHRYRFQIVKYYLFHGASFQKNSHPEYQYRGPVNTIKVDSILLAFSLYFNNRHRNFRNSVLRNCIALFRFNFDLILISEILRTDGYLSFFGPYAGVFGKCTFFKGVQTGRHYYLFGLHICAHFFAARFWML